MSGAIIPGMRIRVAATLVAIAASVGAQQAPPPAAFVPEPILPGGQILPLFPPGSPFLRSDRIAEPEQYNLQRSVPGRIQSIVNIHNPSIEVHPVDRGNQHRRRGDPGAPAADTTR